jgi:hypothetical protein
VVRIVELCAKSPEFESTKWILWIGTFVELRKATLCPSVRLEHIGSHWTDFVKFDVLALIESMMRKFKFHYIRARIAGALREDQYTFMIISRSFLCRMRNVPGGGCRENHNTPFMLNNFFFENRAD